METSDNVRALKRRKRLPPKRVAATITRIYLEQLFGMYTYDIPSSAESLDRVAILYGENGLGKTNILRILFHLLSPAGNRGHRTALGKVRFRRVAVTLSNRIVVTAVRSGESLDGAMRLEVHTQTSRTHTLLGAWDWFPKDDPAREAAQRMLLGADPAVVRTLKEQGSSKERQRALQSVLFHYIERESNPLESEEAFLRALQENVPPIFFLTADRILSADPIGVDAASRVEFGPRNVMRPEVMLTLGREHALDGAVSMASEMLSRQAVRAARQGSTSMHSIYQDLIKRLASRATVRQETLLPIPELTRRLSELSETYDLYAKYGLTPRLQADVLVSLLADVREEEKPVAEEVLRPYVESLTEQANSLAAAYSVIDTLISTVNEYLFDKKLEFSLGEGMLVRNRLGNVLEPKDLSSGEQQLLLLFCHITMAHETGGIFIVDEPEISLNVKWQRRLIESLLRLDSASNLQFILASHSMEILTQRRESVVALAEAKNA